MRHRRRAIEVLQSCSLNSGWERMSSKTVVSGLILAITRVYVASICHARAPVRGRPRPLLDDDLLGLRACVALHAATAAARWTDRLALTGRNSSTRSSRVSRFLWRRFYSRFCRLCGAGGTGAAGAGSRLGGIDAGVREVFFLDFLSAAADQRSYEATTSCGVDEDQPYFVGTCISKWKVIGGRALAPEEIADPCDHLASCTRRPLTHAVGR